MYKPEIGDVVKDNGYPVVVVDLKTMKILVAVHMTESICYVI